MELRYWWEHDKENKKYKLIDTVGIKTRFERKIFVLEFCGFPNCLDVRKGYKLLVGQFTVDQVENESTLAQTEAFGTGGSKVK